MKGIVHTKDEEKVHKFESFESKGRRREVRVFKFTNFY